MHQNLTLSHSEITRSWADYRVWKQKKNILTDNMPDHVLKNVSKIKDLSSSWFDEVKNKKAIQKKQNKYVFFRRSSSVENIYSVSPRAKKLLSKIGSEIKKMKDSNAEITQMNSLYLDHFITTTKNQDTIAYTDNEAHEATPKAKWTAMRNFNYINDHYRKQLNQAFMKFHPLVHLENWHWLQRADPTIKEDLRMLRHSVEGDVKDITDKKHYYKIYEDLMKKHRQISKEERTEEDKKIANSNNNQSGSKISNRKSSWPFNLIKKVVRTPNKEKMLNHMKEMRNSTALLDECIKDSNIKEKIDEAVSGYDNVLNVNEDTEIPVRYFGQQINKISESLRNVHLFTLKRNLSEDEQQLKSQMTKNNQSLPGKLAAMKDSLKKEFQGLIVKYKIEEIE